MRIGQLARRGLRRRLMGAVAVLAGVPLVSLGLTAAWPVPRRPAA